MAPSRLRPKTLMLDAVAGALASLPQHVPIAVAFSGGIDSTALLHASVAVAGAARITALHVHHGLSPHADRWLQHCRHMAQSFQVGFDARRVKVDLTSGVGIEAAAREARYAALDQMSAACGAALLLLGHHADDQAETVLLQMLRGAGLPGLAGMPPSRGLPASGSSAVALQGELRLATPPIIYPPRARPLLAVLRASIEDYAHDHGLRWVDDDSNQDQRFVRNALRAEILPRLATHFPGYRDSLSRSARHAAEAQGLLDELAMVDLQTVGLSAQPTATLRLSRTALNALSEPRAANLIRFWMRRLDLPAPSAARLGNLLNQVRHARRDRNVQVDHAGAQLRIYRDELWWEAAPIAALVVVRDKQSAADAATTAQRGDGYDAGKHGDTRETAEELSELAGIDATVPSYRLIWQGESVWHLPAWRGTVVFVPVDASDDEAVGLGWLQHQTLLASPRRGGERLRLARTRPARSLKNLFQEAGIPMWRRDVPVIYLGTMPLFVPYLGLNRDAIEDLEQTLESSPEIAPTAPPFAPLTPPQAVRIEWRPDMVIA